MILVCNLYTTILEINGQDHLFSTKTFFCRLIDFFAVINDEEKKSLVCPALTELECSTSCYR